MMTDIAPTATERRVCRECGAVFTMTAKDMDWFVAHGLQIPKRCEPCRQERRREALRDKPLAIGGGRCR